MQKLRNEPAFGATLRSLRLAAGLTQEQVVTQMQLMGCDISRSIYSQMECGNYNIRVVELVALRKILNVPYDAFFEGVRVE